MKLVQECKDSWNCFRFALALIWKKEKAYYLVLAAEIIVKAFLPLLLVVIPKYLIDFLMTKQYASAIYTAILFCSIILLKEIVAAFTKNKKSKFELSITGHLSEMLGEKMMSIKYELLERKAVLDEYEFAVKCVQRNSISKISDVFTTIISSLIGIAGVAYILSSLSVLVVILIISVVLLSAVGEIYRMHFIYERQKEETPVERNLYYARDQLPSREFAKEIRLYHLKDYVSEKVGYYAGALCTLWEKAALKSVRVVGWTYLLKGIQLFGVYGYIGTLCMNGRLSIGDFTMFTGAILNLSNAGVEAMNGIVALIEESKYLKQAIHFLQISEAAGNRRQGIARGIPEIVFQDVSFRYPNQEEDAIRHVTLKLSPNGNYAVVGKNGAGKTTFIKLLMGLYTPTSGTILVDGVPLEQIDQEAYFSLFMTVFQDFHLLGFSIKENIAFSQSVQTEALERSIDEADLRQYVAKLKYGADTCASKEYAEEGVELSGGERQKVAIARALYKNSGICILDEPTAALSPQSEFALYQKFASLVEHKTSVFISHRLSSCRLCDQIFVFDQGRLAEEGSHDELMKQGALYSKMFLLQAAPYQEGSEAGETAQGS